MQPVSSTGSESRACILPGNFCPDIESCIAWSILLSKFSYLWPTREGLIQLRNHPSGLISTTEWLQWNRDFIRETCRRQVQQDSDRQFSICMLTGSLASQQAFAPDTRLVLLYLLSSNTRMARVHQEAAMVTFTWPQSPYFRCGLYAPHTPLYIITYYGYEHTFSRWAGSRRFQVIQYWCYYELPWSIISTSRSASVPSDYLHTFH